MLFLKEEVSKFIKVIAILFFFPLGLLASSTSGSGHLVCGVPEGIQ